VVPLLLSLLWTPFAFKAVVTISSLRKLDKGVGENKTDGKSVYICYYGSRKIVKEKKLIYIERKHLPALVGFVM
jgi:hypothetical protein